MLVRDEDARQLQTAAEKTGIVSHDTGVDVAIGAKKTPAGDSRLEMTIFPK